MALAQTKEGIVMYFNVHGEKVSRARWQGMIKGLKNRQEIIAAGLSRREVMKMGLLTQAGMLAPLAGLSAQVVASSSGCYRDCGNQCASPTTTAFVMQLPIMPVKQPVASLNPVPTVAPNTAAGEGRTRNHQALLTLPPQAFYQVTQQAGSANMSPQLPLQPIWGFDGISPGPTYHQTYGQPILVRNVNNLPSNNGGFGINSVTTHLHNNHTPSESDGFPCDFLCAEPILRSALSGGSRRVRFRPSAQRRYQ